jgi:hypothetical protein
MDRSEVITLLTTTRTQDAYGVWTETETGRDVFCQVDSVTRAEFFEGGRNGLNPQYRFTMFATEALYLEEIEFTREYSEGVDEIKMPVGGYDVLMISVEDGLYMFWSDGVGYYSLDIWDTQFSATDIESIITSVQ